MRPSMRSDETTGDFIQRRCAGCRVFSKRNNKTMSIGTILLIILILMLVGAMPSWPHSKSWGYYPSGLIGLILTIVIIMLLLGRI